MTARQLRRAQQKADRKAEKRELRRQPTFAPASEHSLQNPARPAHEAPASMCEQGDVPRFSPISPAKLLANQANAKLSHGPVTMAGKEKVSQNRTVHGLAGSNFRVLPGESQEEFDKMLTGYSAAMEPANELEQNLVQEMAESRWLSSRAQNLQDQAIEALQSASTPEEKRDAQKDFDLYMRYHTQHDRAYYRASSELYKLRNERRRTERGFESQRRQAERLEMAKTKLARRDELQQLTIAIRQANEKRKQERHDMQIRLNEAKIQRFEAAPKGLEAAA